MLDLLGAMVVAVAPISFLIILLRVADVRSRRRDEVVERQIAVTDAIHRELGAVVAPVVHRWGTNGWRVLIAVPVDNPPIVQHVLEIVHRTLQPVPYAIVLTAQRQGFAGRGTGRGRHPLLERAAPRRNQGTSAAA
jgi:hypothetical protein